MRWLETAPASNLDMRAFRAFDLAHPVANCQRVEIDLQAFAQRHPSRLLVNTSIRSGRQTTARPIVPFGGDMARLALV
jgi:hypothetical protein